MGMLEVMLTIIPRATVVYVGRERTEMAAESWQEYKKPPSLDGQHLSVLDAMRPAAGSAASTNTLLKAQGASRIRLLSIGAAPEGVQRLAQAHPGVDVYTAALDRGLDSRKYILPGLGDFGDRLYGTP